MYRKGLVSVIIPTYRRSDMLQRTIDSVLRQTYQYIELIIVNDNMVEDDHSIALYKLLSHIKDTRIRLVEQVEHVNGAAARNAGIRVAKGEYISFLDDDDYWESEKIEKQVNLLRSLDDSWGAVSCLARTYSNGRLIKAALPYRSGNILVDILERRVGLGIGSVLIRREALDDSGYFDENLIRHQDLQLFACLAEHYKIMLDKVYLYNIEIRDRQNEPNPEFLLKIKKDYFFSIRAIIASLPLRLQKKIYVLHNWELAYAFYKRGSRKEAMKYAISVLQVPSALLLAIERCIRRIIEKKLKSVLNKKYSR